MYAKYIKRILDFTLSLVALIILMPLMIILWVLVRIKLGKPAIFKQRRPGKNEKIFTLYKFRTMTDEKDENGKLLPDEKRLTKFRKMLRSTSLDELPELPRYKLDENQQIVIDDLVDENVEEQQEAPMPEREEENLENTENNKQE